MFIIYIYVIILGLVIGSFLNVCIYRIPREESISVPPSHCMNCGTRLKPLDLIPVFSYIFLRGKCRYCRDKISFRYPLIEMITAAGFGVLYYKYGTAGHIVEFIAYSYFFAILVTVFFIDLDHMIIPDGLVIAGLIGGSVITVYNVFNPVEIYGDRMWWNPLVGLFTGSGFLLLIAVIGYKVYKSDEAMGMGDVKIFAPIGLFLGWKMTIVALFLSVVIAGVISLFLIVTKVKDRRSTIPFGPFIVIATYITLVWGWNILNWWYINRYGG
ncbi:MAG: prepilin peptidase [Clostridia bacterium]|nr:prepilin peptidase [Clostridia bacterium]